MKPFDRDLQIKSMFPIMCVQAVSKTLNPQWREQFDLHQYDESGGILEISVWDKDIGRKDEFMGRSVCCVCFICKIIRALDFYMSLKSDGQEHRT